MTRNNCFSLLHDLLSQQKNVSLLRFIKDEQDDVRALIRRVSEESADGARMLEEFAKVDPSIVLDDLGLPPGELATREAIAGSTREELLHSSGEPFEVTLLLAQIQALSYAEFLAWVASRNDPQPSHVKSLEEFSQRMKLLDKEARQLLLAR